MKTSTQNQISIALGGITLLVLAYLTISMPPYSFDIAWILFLIAVTFTAMFGIPIGGGEVSLLPMTSVAGFLVMGALPAGWIAVASSLLLGIARYSWPEFTGWGRNHRLQSLIGTTVANVTMHTASILLGGLAYVKLNGQLPVNNFQFTDLVPLFILGTAYLTVNYLLAGFFIRIRGQADFKNYLEAMPKMLSLEIPAIFFAPLIALIYTQLGLVLFSLFMGILFQGAVILRNQARTQARLERRLQELDSLQAVGQTFSASLDLDDILESIYTQVDKLMPAQNFYVALYHPDAEEIEFRLAYENGEHADWGTRKLRQGLTETVISTKKPLLLENNVAARMEEMGIEHIGREALSWLGAPILYAGEVLGVIAVQSHSLPDMMPQTYDESHLIILATIAAQAAVAIENARLYARTDAALTRRVQELNSILSAAQEGILLVDTQYNVKAANRALSDFLGVSQQAILNQNLNQPSDQAAIAVASMLGYKLKDLQNGNQAATSRAIIKNPGPDGQPLERVLTAVVDADQQVRGWLFVFRDLSEEQKLSQLRDEMTHMLVHDLRSPMVAIQGGLEMIKELVKDDNPEDLDEYIDIAQNSSDRLLNMINYLLEINKLETGEVQLETTPIVITDLLNDIQTRITPRIREAKITVETDYPSTLPILELDPELMGRVIHNILDNAIKFTPDGGQIEISAAPSEDNNCLILRFKDNGPGIPPDQIEKIFHKYHRVANIESRRSGSGLGLAFSRLVVEAHGGEIWAESQPGEGSAFIISLPIAE